MRSCYAISAALMILFISGCGSGGGDPIAPSGDDRNLVPGVTGQQLPDVTGSNRILWGYWDVSVDRQTGEIDIVAQRGVMFNANIAHFLAPPYSPENLLSFLLLPGSDIGAGYLNLKVKLIHPFAGLPKFKGFDVRAVFIADGTSVSDHDPDILYSMEENDEPVMLNPDGLTRWWNPPEFIDPLPILSYKPFASGTQPYPSATLNPYKYFADALGFEDDVGDLPPETRGVFSNAPIPRERNFQIQFPVVGGNPVFLFNIAVDASWQDPDPSGAPDYPIDSFPPGAQCQEAYHVKLDTSGTDAWYSDGDSGGSVRFDIEVFDWQALSNPGGVPAEINALWIESPVLTTPVNVLPLAVISSGSQTTSSIFEVELESGYLDLASSGTFPVLGSVESVSPSTYQPQVDGGENFIFPEGPLAAYFMGTIEVIDTSSDLILTQPNGGEVWTVGNANEVQWEGGYDVSSVKLEYSKDDFISDINTIVEDTPNTGSYSWDPIPNDPSETVRVRVSDVSDPLNLDDSDEYFTIYFPSGGWILVFPDPPVQISDSGSEGWNNEAPRVIEDGQSNIVVSWAQNRPDQSGIVDNRPVDRISNDQGTNWNPMDTFPTHDPGSEGSYVGTKMALDTTGTAYAKNFWIEDSEWTTWWNDVLIRCPLDSDDDWGYQVTTCARGVELIFTDDGYPLCFEDYDLFGLFEPEYEGIVVAKGLYQNSPLGNGHSWLHIGQFYQIVTNPVALSRGPSVQRDSSGTIWLAYQNGVDDSSQILMVNNTDSTMQNWTSPQLVATASGNVIRCFDPTLWLDSTGGMHLAYLRETSDNPPTYSFAYMTAATGDPGDFGSEEEIYNDQVELGYPTIQCADLPLGFAATAMTVSGDGETYAIWKDPSSDLWSSPIQVDLNSQSSTPAMWIDQDNLYVHVVWVEPDGSNEKQVMYRRGQFIQE